MSDEKLPPGTYLRPGDDVVRKAERLELEPVYLPKLRMGAILHAEKERAMLDLVRELAAIDYPYEETDRLPWCFFCHADQDGLGDDPHPHEPSCLWRRAKELVG